MKVIGIVGSIGSGKSTIASIINTEIRSYNYNLQNIEQIEQYGLEDIRYKIIDLDSVSKELYETNMSFRNELIHQFGSHWDTSIKSRREYVINYIFSCDILYKRMCDILEGYFIEYIENEILLVEESGYDYIFIEGVLLGKDNGLRKLLDAIILVDSKLELCYDRVVSRDIYSSDQIDILYNRSKFGCIGLGAVYVIENNLGFRELEGAVKQLLCDDLCILPDKPKKTFSNVFYDRLVIYPGSFNPMHIGHMNIINKMGDIFDGMGDYLLVLKCQNGLKCVVDNRDDYELPDGINFDSCNGSLVDYISNKSFRKCTIVRGIRNANDVQYENDYIDHLVNMCEIRGIDISVVYIPCDLQFSSISSTGIRAIMPFNVEYANSLTV